MPDMGTMTGGAFAWTLLVVVLAVATVVTMVAVVLTLHLRRPAPPVVPLGEEAREILRRRYAAGEIDEDDYLRRLSGLTQR